MPTCVNKLARSRSLIKEARAGRLQLEQCWGLAVSSEEEEEEEEKEEAEEVKNNNNL